MLDFVQGEKFMWIADYQYAPTKRHKDDYCHLVNTLDFSLLKDGDIIYTHIFYVKQLFSILQYMKVKVIIVTHNADENADVIPPDNVICWYSSNVTIEHPRVKSLPLALENNKWFKKVRKLDIMETRLRKPIGHKSLVYLNCNTANNPRERLPIYQMFEGKPWVTTGRGKNGGDFVSYLENICNHKYVFCPRGSNMDCHRRWESLHMGTIPIVRKDSNNWSYGNDLPILFINDWKEVTKELLIDKYPMFINGTWNMKKLTFEYWKNKIYESRN
jgi:hypothetical protein